MCSALSSAPSMRWQKMKGAIRTSYCLIHPDFSKNPPSLRSYERIGFPVSHSPSFRRNAHGDLAILQFFHSF